MTIGTSYYIHREIILNDLARYLNDEIGEGHIIADSRLRRIAYRCKTNVEITPAMDAEILARVGRLRARKRTRAPLTDFDGSSATHVADDTEKRA